MCTSNRAIIEEELGARTTLMRRAAIHHHWGTRVNPIRHAVWDTLEGGGGWDKDGGEDYDGAGNDSDTHSVGAFSSAKTGAAVIKARN